MYSVAPSAPPAPANYIENQQQTPYLAAPVASSNYIVPTNYQNNYPYVYSTPYYVQSNGQPVLMATIQTQQQPVYIQQDNSNYATRGCLSTCAAILCCCLVAGEIAD